VGLKALVLAGLLAASPVSFVQSHNSNGAFSESGGTADTSLTAWAVLGLQAVGADAPGSLAYLEAQEPSLQTANDISLDALAQEALGAHPDALLARLRAKTRPSGQIGETLNSTYWAVLALGRSTSATTRFILSQQTKAGGFAWFMHGQADSNDTAAALEALRVARVQGPPVSRAARFLLTFQNRDGGFELSGGRGSDAQSTAWAIQGLVAAGRTPPRSAFAYLARMKRPDGSYRYSARYVTTPVWVTSQVLTALAKKPFPLP
jgi:hypothetical protein